MRKWWPALAGVLVLVVGVVLVVVRGGDTDDEPTAAPSVTPSSTPTAESMTVEELEALVFSSDLGTSEVLASVDGSVGTRGGPQTSARLDVTDVVANEHSTIAYFTVANTSGSDSLMPLQMFNEFRPLQRNIRDVTLVDPEAAQRYWAYIGQNADGSMVSCACSTAPVSFTERGQQLNSVFPPLDPATTSVTLEVPGFPAVEVPVTRQQ